ncbi:PREDICTED: uncharacterized protein LOC109171115 [Ipomoea nil]|uniref:uncharacterized protein LOC109171115 n=1 Tax=Ipomoea nil TaxID=35883 RepID=UPI0009019BEE|nr:PREDICTED: uncharacterized protein LOC109171115 [Ipomoea nil]
MVTGMLGDFWVAARIVFIDDPEWYYASCRTKGCNKKLKLKGKWLWCSTCDRNWGDGTLRYRIKVRVVDLDGNAPFLLWDRECIDLLGISADDLKDTHTKFQNYLNAFHVMRINTDEKIVEKHAPELIGVRDRDLSSKLELELTDEDLWDLEEADQANEAESPLQVVAQRLDAENSIENGTVKRSLIDEFSSTQSPVMGTGFVIVPLQIFFCSEWCHNEGKSLQIYGEISQEMADMAEQNEEYGIDISKSVEDEDNI